ncbi:MAG: hypothetical protein PVJ39_04645 [Gammaproteobacteria bacterium]
MNTIEMDGAKIECVSWPQNAYGEGRSLPSHAVDELYFSAAYHGDRYEFWIVAVQDGQKTLHNPKYVESIVFAKEDSTNDDA